MGTHSVRTSLRVGRLLRERRKALRMTLREVEKRMSAEAGERLPASTLVRIEQGKLDPGVRRLQLLIRLYRIPSELVADLVELESNAIEPDAGLSIEQLIEEGERLWRAGEVHAAIGHVLELRERAAGDDEARILRQRATLRFASYARNLGKLPLARRLLDELLCEPPGPEVAIDVLVLAASVWRELGAHDAAVAFIREAARRVLEADLARIAVVRHQEAKILLAAGRAAEAETALSAAFEAYAADADRFASFNADRARILRAEILEALGRPEAALASAEAALASSTRHDHQLVALFARIVRGRLLVAVGRKDDGVLELRRALSEAVFRGDENAEAEAKEELRRVSRQVSRIGEAADRTDGINS